MSRCREPKDCALLCEDYLVCLHHSKEVVNDGDMYFWRELGVNSWPTFAIIGPNGNLIVQVSGEGHRKQIEEGKLRCCTFSKCSENLAIYLPIVVYACPDDKCIGANLFNFSTYASFLFCYKSLLLIFNAIFSCHCFHSFGSKVSRGVMFCAQCQDQHDQTTSLFGVI